MTKVTFNLKAKLARRLPDPNFQRPHGLEHHLLLVAVNELPPDVPMEANARRPNTNKQVYREVRESLLNEVGEPGTFHLKNKGIVIIAESVQQISGASDEYRVVLDRTCQGILDGGHTYQLIQEAKTQNSLPSDQYVFVQIRTGVPQAWVPDISRGLNTSVQVQDMSLDKLKGLFAWLIEDLKGQSYYKRIGWSENEECAYDARDIIALLYLFNIGLFPNSDSHPIAGYEKKSEALRKFEENEQGFRNLRPVLKDILFLHDYVARTAADFYNQGAKDSGLKARGRALRFIKQGKRPFSFIFMGDKELGDCRLEEAALYPILAAFRLFLVQDHHSGECRWSTSFTQVKQAWAGMAFDLIKATHNTATEVGSSNNQIGKSRLHWDGIYQKVENYKLKQQQGVLAPNSGKGTLFPH